MALITILICAGLILTLLLVSLGFQLGNSADGGYLIPAEKHAEYSKNSTEHGNRRCTVQPEKTVSVKNDSGNA